MVLFRVNDEVEIVGLKEESQKAVVTGVEMFRKQLDEGIAGDTSVSFFVVSNVMKSKRGQVLAKPGSIHPHTNSKVKFTSLLKMKVDVILHSSTTTVHNSTSVQLTLQVQSNFQQVLKW